MPDPDPTTDLPAPDMAAPQPADADDTRVDATTRLPPPDTTPDPAPEPAPPASAGPAVPELSPAACSARLAALFPALFALQQPLPLKLRVQADIQHRAPGIFTKKSLSIFLHRYTTGTPYLVALAQQPQRYDLDGQPAGEVAAEHRDAANAELARRRGLHAERRERERTAAREQEAAAAADVQARRERATLLRAFETSTLTRANFLALKGLSDDALEAALQQARQERSERPERAGDDRRRPVQPPDRRGPQPEAANRRGPRHGPARGERPPRP